MILEYKETKGIELKGSKVSAEYEYGQYVCSTGSSYSQVRNRSLAAADPCPTLERLARYAAHTTGGCGEG
jgi:hypothetical protein